jgi:ABC-type multidrug transport system ATPase subunit
MTVCYQTQYCPNGTFEADPCPAGYYCPTPNEKIICPEHHFCKLGSIVARPCPIFSVCPEGTENLKMNFGILVYGGAIFLLGIAAWKLYHYMQDRMRRVRERLRMDEMISFVARPEKISEMDFTIISTPVDIPKPKLSKRARRSLKSFLHRKKDFFIDFAFEDLGLEISKGSDKIKVLAGVTGEIKHGRVTAVMGPSGAGKTTFLTTLAGKAYYGAQTGKILINGQESKIQHFRKLLGFVPQEDIMLRTLTVKEILTCCADLRLPKKMGAKERRAIVNGVISLLGLDEQRHSIIGDETDRGISGGQRKRVNIGMELVSDPTVLFLDEPTSGLDSSTSQEVCDSLRKVAEKGLTVVAVIHQPRYEIFRMFHDVLLLGKGGRTVYLGPSEEALSYFENLGFKCPQHTNPADFFMDVISGLVHREGDPAFKPEDLFRFWEEDKLNGGQEKRSMQVSEDRPLNLVVSEDISEYTAGSEISDVASIVERDQESIINHQDYESAPLLPSVNYDVVQCRRESSGFWFQFWLFFRRSLIQQMRDIKSVLVDIFLTLFSASVLGVVFMDKTYKGPLPETACHDIQIEFLKDTCTLPVDDPYPQIAGLSCLVLALTAATSALRVFGPEKVTFWRENASGSSTLAYYLGKDVAQLPTIFGLPLLFLGVFYTLTAPRAGFASMYWGYLLTWYCAVAIGYFVSVIVRPNIAQVGAVVAILICMIFSGLRPSLKEFSTMAQPMKFMPNLSFLRWSNELLYLMEIWQWKDIYKVEAGVEKLEYTLSWDQIIICHLFILAIALFFRIATVFFMSVLHKSKRQ